MNTYKHAAVFLIAVFALAVPFTAIGDELVTAPGVSRATWPGRKEKGPSRG